MAQAGSNKLYFSVAPWIKMSRLWINILKPVQVILMKKTSFEHHFFMFSYTHQNNNTI